MPGLVLGDTGAEMMLKAILNNVWPAGGKNWTIKLYTNNYTPLDTSTAGNFTEATGGGYASKTLTNGSWTVGSAALRQGTYAKQTWTFTGALTGNPTIYGYNVVDADGVHVDAQLLSQPFTPINNGDPLSVTPVFALSFGTPA